MLKFESWPPEAGKVQITERGLGIIAESPQDAIAAGVFAAELVFANTDLTTAAQVLTELSSQYETASVEVFCQAGRDYIARAYKSIVDDFSEQITQGRSHV